MNKSIRPRRPGSFRLTTATLATVLVCWAAPSPAAAQIPFSGEVRQLVTFRFLPGRAPEAIALYEDEALPLYRMGSALRSFRALREVESPVPLDLVAVSSFAGMAGMDESNGELRRLAEERGTSIPAVYGRIGALAASHDDQFVEMLPHLGAGDPTAEPLVALIWYRTLAGEQEQFERTLAEVVAWERENEVIAATGRFLVADGWTHLRFLGFASLAAYQRYWQGVRGVGAHDYLQGITHSRRQMILAPVPTLSVR